MLSWVTRQPPGDLCREQIRLNRELLIEAAAEDTGRTAAETKWLEWAQVESAFTFLKRERAFFKPTAIRSSYPLVMGRRSLVQRRLPMGRVLIVGTWNFPLGLHLPQILFALAAGNDVVFKPSPYAKKTAAALARSMATCAAFSVWQPGDDECLVEIRRGAFDLVIFTGGSNVAKIFAHACADSLTPLIAEASGVESAIVTQNGAADFNALADHLLWSIFHNSGQTCIAPRFWFVPRHSLDGAFIKACKVLEACPQSVSATRPPLKNQKISEEHAHFIKWANAQGAVGAHLFSVTPEFLLLQIEDLKQLSTYPPPTFGPAAVMVGYESIADLVDWINHSPWSLMTSVFGEVNLAERATLLDLKTSVVSLNEAVVAAGDASVALAGRGASGYGACRGIEGLAQLSRLQTWVEVRPWFGLKKALLRPGLQNIEKINNLNAFEMRSRSKVNEVKNAES